LPGLSDKGSGAKAAKQFSRHRMTQNEECPMAAYVHINLRVIDASKQAELAPRFLAALEEAGGRVLYFGPVAQVLEGDAVPLPMAGVVEFPTLAQALAFYESDRYAPIKADRRKAQQAQIFVVNVG
jgi:uncharacterized protein (DUF1330 family)